MKQMKKFLIEYRPSLGSYLDEKDIPFNVIAKGNGNEWIQIWCKDVNELFKIGCDYEKWYIENIEVS